MRVGRLSAGVVVWVARHGCRASAAGPWMALRRVPTPRHRSEGTAAKRGPYASAMVLVTFAKTKVTRPSGRNQNQQRQNVSLAINPGRTDHTAGVSTIAKYLTHRHRGLALLVRSYKRHAASKLLCFGTTPVCAPQPSMTSLQRIIWLQTCLGSGTLFCTVSSPMPFTLIVARGHQSGFV